MSYAPATAARGELMVDHPPRDTIRPTHGQGDVVHALQPLTQELPGRIATGPLGWRRKLAHDTRLAAPFYLARILDGVRWPCPNCARPDSVALTSRGARLRHPSPAGPHYVYYYKCANWGCRYRRKFSFMHAPDFLAQIGAPLLVPGKSK